MNTLANVILRDIKDAEVLGKLVAEQTIKKLSPKKISSEKSCFNF